MVRGMLQEQRILNFCMSKTQLLVLTLSYLKIEILFTEKCCCMLFVWVSGIVVEDEFWKSIAKSMGLASIMTWLTMLKISH